MDAQHSCENLAVAPHPHAYCRSRVSYIGEFRRLYEVKPGSPSHQGEESRLLVVRVVGITYQVPIGPIPATSHSDFASLGGMIAC